MAFLFKRSNGIYYHIVQVKGKSVWKSTGGRTKAEAERYLLQTEAPKPPQQEITLLEFLPQFEQYAVTNLAPTTVLIYKQAVKVFARIMGNRPLRGYIVQDAEIFKAQRVKEVSPVKVNIDFRTLRSFFETAKRWSLIETNPFRGVKQIRIPQQQPTYLTKEGFQTLLAVVDQPWFKDLITFAVCTMLRSGEILSLTWDSVDLEKRLIHVQNTDNFRVKTSKPRTVPMNAWVHSFLTGKRVQTGHIFTFPNGKRPCVHYVSHRFKKYVSKAGLPFKIHFHSLRHTGASWLAQAGVSIYAIQKILGHSSVVTTQVYSHLEVDGLFQSVEKITV